MSNSSLPHPMDCILPGSSVHGISQARMVEWVAIPFSRHHLSGSSLLVWCIMSSIFICEKETYRLLCSAAMGTSYQRPFSLWLPHATPVSSPAVLLTRLLLAAVSSFFLHKVRKPGPQGLCTYCFPDWSHFSLDSHASPALCSNTLFHIRSSLRTLSVLITCVLVCGVPHWHALCGFIETVTTGHTTSFVVQSLSRVRLSVTPWTAARQASLSFTIS